MSWEEEADLTVEVAFDATGPYDTAVTWTDITAYVAKGGIATRWGRLRELEQFEPGFAEIELDNTGRRFDPLHATGPYYGTLLPNRPIRIRATYDATTEDIFVGFVDGWPQDYEPSSIGRCKITASDAGKLLGNQKLAASVYEIEVLADDPHQWIRFTDSTTGGEWADASGNDRALFYVDHQTVDLPRGDVIVAGCGPSARVPADVLGAGYQRHLAGVALYSPLTLEFWVKVPTYRAGNFAAYAARGSGYPYLVVAGETTGRFDGGAKVIWWFSAGSYVHTADVIEAGKVHHVAVTKSGGTVEIFVDGVSQPLTTVGAVGFLPGSEMDVLDDDTDGETAFAEWAMYASALSAERILEHYNAGTAPWDGDDAGTRIDRILDLAGYPAGAAWRNIDTGDTVLGPVALGATPKAMGAAARAAAGEQGLLYCDHRDGGVVRFEKRANRFTAAASTAVQFVLSDDPAEPYHYETLDLQYDERDIVNSVAVKWAAGTETSSDAASIALYGEIAHPVETDLPTAAQARSLGEWIVARYKVPAARCRSVSINPAVNPDLFAVALGVRVSDRISITRTPDTGAPITKEMLVEGIEHVIADGVNKWTTTLRLSEADTAAYWIWGTSEWGETTRWGW